MMRIPTGSNFRIGHLSEGIYNSRSLLPKGADVAALQRLRKTANAILHLDTENEIPLSKLESIQMEMEILSLLRVLRALIEGAPQWPLQHAQACA